MTLHGVYKKLQSLSGDTTNSNTRWEAGIIACLGKMLWRKVIWLICKLHTNELEMSHLFEELGGNTDSSSG